jgi:hypothetical protein
MPIVGSLASASARALGLLKAPAAGGVAGYFSRGDGTAFVYKWAFPSDTVSTTTNAPFDMEAHAGFAAKGFAGYFHEGDRSDNRNFCSFTFPSDTVSSRALSPSPSRQNAAFFLGDGYMSRGDSTTTVFRYNFDANTWLTTSSTPASMEGHAGFVNLPVAGYFSRGNGTNTIYKFNGLTWSSTTSSTFSLYRHAGFSNNGVAGYFTGGDFTPERVAKWVFPSDTNSTFFITPRYARHGGGFSNNGVAGYFNQADSLNAVYKVAFPTDTISTTTSAPNSMNRNAGFANA